MSYFWIELYPYEKKKPPFSELFWNFQRRTVVARILGCRRQNGRWIGYRVPMRFRVHDSSSLWEKRVFRVSGSDRFSLLQNCPTRPAQAGPLIRKFDRAAATDWICMDGCPASVHSDVAPSSPRTISI